MPDQGTPDTPGGEAAGNGRDPREVSREQLRRELETAQEVFRRDPRQGAMAALSATIDFVNAEPGWARADLSLPLWMLLAGLDDLGRGRVVSMLERNEAGQNRPPDSSMRQVVRAYAIYTVDRLKAGGHSIEAACRAVAKTVAGEGFIIGGRRDRPDWKVLRGWRQGMSKRESDLHPDAMLLDVMNSDPNLMSVPADVSAEIALDNLRTALSKLGRAVLE